MLAARHKQLTTALKVVFSGVLLYFIFTKIPFGEISGILAKAKLGYLIGSALLIVLSKVVGAIRLNLYFHQMGILLTQLGNFKLYLLGMFYNLFLPGGIGGDAYKGYLIKKKFNTPTKQVVSTLVLDRLSGLLAILVLACILAALLPMPQLAPYRIPIWIMPLLAITVFWWINKTYFGYVLPVFWKSFLYSLLLQSMQMLAVYWIMKSLHIESNTVAYLVIFLVSSIVSVVPITLGGIGSREVTFYYGALWLGLEQNVSVSVSLVFFLINALVSLIGIIFHFKKPELKTLPVQ